jgi:hypothetical protein
MRFLYFILACFLVSVASIKAQLNQQDPVWMAQQVPPSTINNGLTGYWKLNEGTGTTAFDSSGAGQNGTLESPATWASFNGVEAASFDGTSGYVNIPTVFDLVGTNAVSVSAWFYCTSLGVSGKEYYFETSSNGSVLFYTMATDAEGLNNTIYTGSDGAAVADGLQAPANSITLNQWINVVILRVSNTNTSIYVNGVFQIKGASGASMLAGGTSVQIGNRADKTRGFIGGICGVRVWNRIITTNEMATLYNNGPANP